MIKIALLCQHGASTGICVKKMQEYATSANIEAEIVAYSFTQLGNVVDAYDCLLLGPQLGFKLNQFKKDYPESQAKFAVINPVDFGMMDGQKIVEQAIALIDSLK